MKTLNAFRRVRKNIKNKVSKIKNLIQKIINKKIVKSAVKKIGILSMVSKVVVVSMVMAAIPAGTIPIKADSQNNTVYQTAVKLDLTKANPIVLAENRKPEIVLGESNFDRQQREVKESALAKYSRSVVIREKVARYDPDLATKRILVQKAAAQYGIDWKILEAVWEVESGKSWDTNIHSYAGAQGPMQFMVGTWNKYAVDGNADGQKDINDAEDAVYTAANLLAQAGAAEGNIDAALLSYNHAQWYVNKVKTIADSIQD